MKSYFLFCISGPQPSIWSSWLFADLLSWFFVPRTNCCFWWQWWEHFFQWHIHLKSSRHSIQSQILQLDISGLHFCCCPTSFIPSRRLCLQWHIMDLRRRGCLKHGSGHHLVVQFCDQALVDSFAHCICRAARSKAVLRMQSSLHRRAFVN